MELLLRRNYLVLTCSHDTKEWVAVELESGEKEHVRWLGFASHEGQISDTKRCYILCNGWRHSFDESWNYLEQGEFIAGIITGQGVYAVYEHREPVLCKKA